MPLLRSKPGFCERPNRCGGGWAAALPKPPCNEGPALAVKRPSMVYELSGLAKSLLVSREKRAFRSDGGLQLARQPGIPRVHHTFLPPDGQPSNRELLY